ncbi:SNF2 domain-containing protein CLASSY 4 [Vicia villosa]|uniref:SNF2 domain-containing protein CLASSY 4 n=1 Tax=Vicia villosa TaxID=3911 RepID=UPI00273C4E30|nr:SNF2 domain-containing protein CLASSY 4 [Vicia villosa]
MAGGVSSRTRSKNVQLFNSVSLDGPSSSKLKRSRKDYEDETGFHSASCSKKTRVKEKSFVLSQNIKVICIDDDDDDDGDDDVKRKVGSDESGRIDGLDAKKQVESVGGSHDHLVDENYDDDESDESETSDEEFQVNEVSEVSDNDNINSSSYDNYDDDEKEEKKNVWSVVEELVREVKDEKSGVKDGKSGIEESNSIEEVKIQNSPSSVHGSENAYYASVTTSSALEKKGSFDPMKPCASSNLYEEFSETTKAKSVEIVSLDDDDDESVNVGDSDEGKEQYVRGLGVEGVSLFQTKQEKMGGSDKHTIMESNERDHEYRANIYNGEKNESMENKGRGHEGRANIYNGEKKEFMENKGRDHEGRAKIYNGEKKEFMENKGRDHESRVNIYNDEKKESMDNNGLMNQRDKNTLFLPKELRSTKRLAEFYWGNKTTVKNDSIVMEVKGDVVDRQPPLVSVEVHPLIWSLKKVKKLQKTKEEEEEQVLWDEMNASLREEEAESMIGNLGANGKMASPYSLCEHDSFLDEEIGVYCKLCGFVFTDIKDVSPPVVDRFPNGSGKRSSFDNSVNVSPLDGSQFNVSDGGDSEANHFSHVKGTVWDLIPGVKQTLYPHQQEGFEFIWKNLAGNINLHELKYADPHREGGCIISHAPGTGKTRLTIVFLMAYLKVFPECHPVIVAPASLLLTWEDEFKKWDIGVPFHNFNNLELSDKEYRDAVNADNWYNLPPSKDTTRKAKLISWFKEKSIMGISYNLYEKLAGGGGGGEGEEFQDKKKKKNASVEKTKDNSDIGKVLREIPGLLVLDEGHTPRNQRSRIWKVLSKIQTKKRIILSGTPFQNNFYELYNTLSLVKPSFPNTIPRELKKFCQKQEPKKTAKEWSWEANNGNTRENPSDDKIMQFKFLMDPFVHVHKGAILQKKLPGLRDCVLALKPDRLQKQILESIQSSQNTLIYEHKVTMASVHPSLLLECGLLEEEESVIDKNRLEKLRLNPYEGVKTKFLVEFVRLCDAVNEKVLVFSQFIRPLSLIKDQLNMAFNWSEGKEMLYMDGKVDLKDKQSLIHSFNDENCQAKILLASTKACSEGISLVGASRVVLLDVVWNPSVERQAISRAYRIGQKKVVYTYHLLTQGTTEYLKYCKQAEKDRLSQLVFSTKDELKSCAVEFQDRVLDQMKQHEKLKDMFGDCVVQPKERDLVDSFGHSL